MATVSRRDDRSPVLARRLKNISMNMAARARRQQETSNGLDYIQQRHVRRDLQDTNSPVNTPQDNTQPTPSSRLSRQPLVTTDSKGDAQPLPGVNQADPGKISNPMPGKNQPQPSIDIATAALLFPDGQTSTGCKTMTTYLTMTKTRADPALTTSGSGMNTGFAWPTPTTSRAVPTVSSAPSPAPVLSFSTFVLFSRSEDIKEQVTTTISSSQSANTPFGLTTSPTLTAVPVPSTRPTPSNIASSAVDGSSTGLSPLSRSLFVLFGVLGAITMLIAVAVFYVARRTRKRQEQADRYIEDVPFESSKGVYDYGSKPRMSADTMHGLPPFLTESERNIVRRAATQDGQPEAHITAPGARLHDAINSFIAKSRRLTYKISP